MLRFFLVLVCLCCVIGCSGKSFNLVPLPIPIKQSQATALPVDLDFGVGAVGANTVVVKTSGDATDIDFPPFPLFFVESQIWRIIDEVSRQVPIQIIYESASFTNAITIDIEVSSYSDLYSLFTHISAVSGVTFNYDASNSTYIFYTSDSDVVNISSDGFSSYVFSDFLGLEALTSYSAIYNIECSLVRLFATCVGERNSIDNFISFILEARPIISDLHIRKVRVSPGFDLAQFIEINGMTSIIHVMPYLNSFFLVSSDPVSLQFVIDSLALASENDCVSYFYSPQNISVSELVRISQSSAIIFCSPPQPVGNKIYARVQGQSLATYDLLLHQLDLLPPLSNVRFYTIRQVDDKSLSINVSGLRLSFGSAARPSDLGFELAGGLDHVQSYNYYDISINNNSASFSLFTTNRIAGDLTLINNELVAATSNLTTGVSISLQGQFLYDKFRSQVSFSDSSQVGSSGTAGISCDASVDIKEKELVKICSFVVNSSVDYRGFNGINKAKGTSNYSVYAMLLDSEYFNRVDFDKLFSTLKK